MMARLRFLGSRSTSEGSEVGVGLAEAAAEDRSASAVLETSDAVEDMELDADAESDDVVEAEVEAAVLSEDEESVVEEASSLAVVDGESMLLRSSMPKDSSMPNCPPPVVVGS